MTLADWTQLKDLLLRAASEIDYLTETDHFRPKTALLCAAGEVAGIIEICVLRDARRVAEEHIERLSKREV